MRILVTGASNPFGAAVCQALAKAGHEVRAFGVPAGADPFHGAKGISCFPGDIATGGSVEPVAAQCQAIVHCSNLDAPVGDKVADGKRIESGTRYTRFSAERELVTAFVALMPTVAPRGLGPALKQAETLVRATRAIVPHQVLAVADPAEAARQVTAALAKVAVTA